MRISLACHRKTLFDEDRRLLGADGVAAGRILDAVTGSKPGFAHGIDAVDAGAVGTAGVAIGEPSLLRHHQRLDHLFERVARFHRQAVELVAVGGGDCAVECRETVVRADDLFGQAKRSGAGETRIGRCRGGNERAKRQNEPSSSGDDPYHAAAARKARSTITPSSLLR
jgi:hypothetical protein